MKTAILVLICTIAIMLPGTAQTVIFYPYDTVKFSGQASAWALWNSELDDQFFAGGRYLPQINYGLVYPGNRLLDFEIAMNMNGMASFNTPNGTETDAYLKLYRGWVRYSNEQYELRLGLQKINFGSASMLRPLMWFDRLDPRDPLQLTEGVWGLLARYYFLNNVNVWGWVLRGNETPSVWEVVNTHSRLPEYGGRLQVPVKRGEIALSYNHRAADARELGKLLQHAEWKTFDRIPEDRFGLDGKWDLEVGLWFEATWTHKMKDMGLLTNQALLNLGVDYTFPLGNGLNVIAEQLVIARDNKPFELINPLYFTGMSVSYPIGMFDNLNAIVYYDWFSGSTYNFLSWKKQFNRISLHSMVFLNPETNRLPMANDQYNLMGGKGIQFMIVYNH